MEPKPKANAPKQKLKQKRAAKHARPSVVRPPTKRIARPKKETVVLRPHQKQAIQACLEAIENGLTRIGVSAPTGSGKTIIGVKLIEQVIQCAEDKVLILVNGLETFAQAIKQTKFIIGMKAAISIGIEHEKTESASSDNV